ncbi:MFS general substrate transporter [Sistotremastrum niveocremeum HHB9708]|uniref:MFS general substrate transporter n=1 Tax=Sistotremastrum niveocremeum HHB9708 TaxID=1314777 RepID=A0A164XUS7_9AGAM|nr:MFS general substrate transporter [Sistotremastrum niveocremeum HHB9708]
MSSNAPTVVYESSDAGKDPEKGSRNDSSSSVGAVQLDEHIDVAAELVLGHSDDAEPSAQESKRLRRKLDWHILPLLALIYTRAGSLAASSILGLLKDAHLSSSGFNNANSAFYIGLLALELPQNWALQRLPVGKWLAFNIFLWSVFLGMQPLCKHFGSLFFVRFLLGASEGAITAGLMLVTSMFYTRTEIGERIGWVFSCNGVALIISGFLSFGVAHISPKDHPDQWEWLMIILAVATFLTSIVFWFYFPDNPVKVTWLTQEEKIKVVKRVRGNMNGIETKRFKMYQLREALLDTKTWVFFFAGCLANIQSGIGSQYSLVIKAYGFTTLTTTLLNIPSGATQILGIFLGCYLLRKFPNSRAWIGIAFWIPSIIADFLSLYLPLENKGGLLAAIYLLYFGGSSSFIMLLSYVTSSVSGHTKKVTTNAIFLMGYGLGQVLCTQFWKAQYRPRNHIPWVITLVSHVADILFLLLIRQMFAMENQRRDALQASAPTHHADGEEKEEYGWVSVVDEAGVRSRKERVEKAFLDLTDRENLNFRYPL